MRPDVSSLHQRTPNFLLDREDSDFDEGLLTSWQVFLRAEGKSPKTIDGYVQSMGRLMKFIRAKGMPGLTQLRREHVAAWMDELRASGNKPATIHTRYRGASLCFRDWTRSLATWRMKFRSDVVAYLRIADNDRCYVRGFTWEAQRLRRPAWEALAPKEK